MNAQDLKNSILQRAIEGKLVPQRKEEGTAKELLAEIRTEKARLIKEKKIKKSKPLPEITDEEKPFDIPDSWEWVRLKDLGQFSSGKTPSKQVPSNWTNGTVNWFTSKDIKSDYLSRSQILISEEAANGLQLYPVGTILMVVRSDILKRLFPVSFLENPGTINQDIKAFQIYDSRISKYLFLCLKGLSPYILKQFRKQVTTVDSLRFEDFSIMPIPMPPLAEQQRILDRVAELQPDIDAYDKAQTKLQAIEQRFPDAMKKSLLQYAIEGKLVPQRKEEGNAKDLLAKIRAEKAQLIKEKKIKKSKPLPAITDDEKPFDIPDSWAWCYINDVAFVTKLAGFEYTKNIHPNLVKNGIPLFKGKNIQAGYLIERFESYIPEKISDMLPRSQISSKCLLVPYVGTIGNIAIFNGKYKAHLGSNVGKIEVFNNNEIHVLEEYVLAYLKSYTGYIELTKTKKATAQSSISIDAIRKVMFPLPPLAEQHRIVAKLEELLLLCQQLASQS